MKGKQGLNISIAVVGPFTEYSEKSLIDCYYIYKLYLKALYLLQVVQGYPLHFDHFVVACSIVKWVTTF